ncbi:MAG: hypothetical protein MZW92_18195 [Comamonadaceae bacterium]|nr:hypothetical protein [Comamonadaceae bacterium]
MNRDDCLPLRCCHVIAGCSTAPATSAAVDRPYPQRGTRAAGRRAHSGSGAAARRCCRNRGRPPRRKPTAWWSTTCRVARPAVRPGARRQAQRRHPPGHRRRR